jgi:hypothetical protein
MSWLQARREKKVGLQEEVGLQTRLFLVFDNSCQEGDVNLACRLPMCMV